MHIATTLLIAVIALLHVWFAVLEMVFWTKPLGIKTFGRTQQQANDSASLALNQGLYNLFLVAGLVWSLVAAEPTARALRLFFLGCVAVAGVVGGLTAARKILLVQAAPAALALALVLLGGS